METSSSSRPRSTSRTPPIDPDGKAIAIRGVVAEDDARTPLTVLDGDGAHRVLVCRSGEDERTVFENLVVTNGHDPAGGNGMANLDASHPTLRHCTFTLNGASATSPARERVPRVVHPFRRRHDQPKRKQPPTD